MRASVQLLMLAGMLVIQRTSSAQAVRPISPARSYASKVYGAKFDASKAFDGSLATYWSAGGVASQWIEADLGSTKAIGNIHFMPSLQQGTRTSWEIYASTSPIRGNTRGATLVKSFRFSEYRPGQFLLSLRSSALRARYVQIRCVRCFPDRWPAVTEVRIFPLASKPKPKPVARKYPVLGRWVMQNFKPGFGTPINLTATDAGNGRVKLEIAFRDSASRPGASRTYTIRAPKDLTFRATRVEFARTGPGRRGVNEVFVGFFFKKFGADSMSVYQKSIRNNKVVTSPTSIFVRRK